MRYIGSKDNLLHFIEAAVREAGVSGGMFLDLFAGTTVVGRHFKRLGFNVASNDLMRYAYVFGKAYIESNDAPAFDGLSLAARPALFESPLGRLEAALESLNNLPPSRGFIYDHYCDEGSDPRMYFSAGNAGRIDAIRNRLEAWRDDGSVTEAEFHILLAALLEAVPGVSNTSGTYGSYLKFWESRSQKILTLAPPPLVLGSGRHRAFQRDGVELLRDIATDVVYLDPPYNARQYAPNYHILETVARWDSPKVYGKSGLRPYQKEKSAWCRQDTALAALRDAACTADARLFLLSYNSEGIMPDEAIRETLALRGPVTVHERPYRRYKSDSDGENRKYKPHKTILERIYAVRT